MSTALTPGGDTPLAAARVTVEVTAPRRLDVSGLLLTASGKVRSDADFVYFNAPTGPGVSHRPATGSRPDAITVDTWAVPSEITRVVVTASPADPGTGFTSAAPTATVRDADSGQVLVTFTPPKPGPETALVMVEVYRRGAEWKVRAVGRGHPKGLAGLAGGFGVSVEGPAEGAGTTSAAPAPPRPSHAPSTPPMPSGPPRATLDKGRVSLTRGGAVSLTRNGRSFLSSVRIGLGWALAGRGRSLDLDASCLVFDARRERLDTAWFMRLAIYDGAILHAGEESGADDDATITVRLNELPPEVCGLVFVVNSFSGQKFTEVKDAYCRLLDADSASSGSAGFSGSAGSGDELVRFDLTDVEPQSGVVMGKLVRQFSGEWVMTAIGEYVDARTARGMVGPAATML